MFEKMIIGVLLSIPLGVVSFLLIMYLTRKSRSETGDVVNLDKMSWLRQNIFVLFFLSLILCILGWLMKG